MLLKSKTVEILSISFYVRRNELNLEPVDDLVYTPIKFNESLSSTNRNTLVFIPLIGNRTPDKSQLQGNYVS